MKELNFFNTKMKDKVGQDVDAQLQAQHDIKAPSEFNDPSPQKKGSKPVDYGKYKDSSSDDDNQIGKIDAGDGPAELSEIERIS